MPANYMTYGGVIVVFLVIVIFLLIATLIPPNKKARRILRELMKDLGMALFVGIALGATLLDELITYGAICYSYFNFYDSWNIFKGEPRKLISNINFRKEIFKKPVFHH